MLLLNLFLEFLKVGTFSFGGGMSTLPYIYEMAKNTHWITEERITNLISVSQVTPGPIACNIGTIVGFKTFGVIGALICNLAFVIPAIIFMGVIYKFFNKIQKNKKINEIIIIIRAATLSIIITSSASIFKIAFLNNSEIINLNNLLFLINYRSIFLGIVIYYISKNKKINFIFLIIISGLFAGIINL